MNVLLFGGFGAFAVFEMWAANRRGAKKSDKKFSINRDLLLIVVGVIVYGAILYLHPYLFGFSAVP